MASLAEHLSAPPVELAPAAPVTIIANLAPLGLLCVSLTLVAVSCSVLAYCRLTPTRR